MLIGTPKWPLRKIPPLEGSLVCFVERKPRLAGKARVSRSNATSTSAISSEELTLRNRAANACHWPRDQNVLALYKAIPLPIAEECAAVSSNRRKWLSGKRCVLRRNKNSKPQDKFEMDVSKPSG